MADWPSSLDQSLQVTGFQEATQHGVLRSKVDAGPPKQRRRFSATPQKLQGFIIVDRTDMATFKTFWDETISGGADSFNWSHPVTGDSASMRFTEPYQITPHMQSKLFFEIHLKLEILP